jgi:hypothetical protein
MNPVSLWKLVAAWRRFTGVLMIVGRKGCYRQGFFWASGDPLRKTVVATRAPIRIGTA